MSESSSDDNFQWYMQKRPIYTSLSELVRGTVEGLIKHAGIDYLSVTHRAKTIESFAEKIERKSYSDPINQMTDLAGVRVITFIDKDVSRVCEIIRETFRVDGTKSLDKGTSLKLIDLDIDRYTLCAT